MESRTPYLVERSNGYLEYQLPISLKAVILWRGRVPLLRNERDEWELPGGKLELGEDPRLALRREIAEELDWNVEVGEPFQTWVYRIRADRHVFIVTFRASYGGDGQPRRSTEHKALGLFTPAEIATDAVRMPAGYKEAVALVAA
jgi:ADP-ribose pyrophosphatase YjhB (NUDIX family)